MLNRSGLASSKHMIMDWSPEKEEYRVILEDVGEDEEDNLVGVGRRQQEESPGKEEKDENYMKSHEYIRLSEQDLINL